MKAFLIDFLSKRLKLWHVALPLLIIANLGYLSHNLFTWFITLATFFTIPGYLLLRQIRYSNISRWETTSLSITLSLFLFIVGGLVLNSLHGFGMQRPLTTLYTFITLDVIFAVLLVINFTQLLHFTVPTVRFSWEYTIVAVCCTLLPFLAVGGAMRLNNGASNILVMILMAAIAILFVYLTSRPTLRSLYPYALFTAGVSILFCNSLRGFYITGHDIHHEFAVFEAVMNKGYWQQRTSVGDPYNACLSITILPAMIAKITHIPDTYIYKAVYQIIFALFLPTLFYMFKRFASPQKAFIGVFAFMSFPTFTNDLPFLNRQEVALLFFIMLLCVNFTRMAQRSKTTLTIIFLVSIILSHYSSSYVTVALLLFSPLYYKLFTRKLPKTTNVSMPLLRVSTLLAALLLTFVWNAQVTASTGNLRNTVTDTIINLVGPSNEKAGFSYSFFLPPAAQSPQKLFKDYAKQENGDVHLLPKGQLPATALGSAISKIYKVQNLNQLNIVFHAVIAKVLQLLVVVGTIVLIVRFRKVRPTRRQAYFTAMACACLTLLMLFTVLPQLSVDYDVTRLFQQSLIVLWLPGLILAELFFSFLGRYRLTAVAILFAFLYLNLTGFIPQLTGGFPAQLPLNDSGTYFDYFYDHKSDILGTQWLGANEMKRTNISFDVTSSSPLLNYTVGTGFMSSQKTGYVYLDYADVNKGSYRAIVQGVFMEYTNPAVISGRDKIYTNQDSQVYLK